MTKQRDNKTEAQSLIELLDYLVDLQKAHLETEHCYNTAVNTEIMQVSQLVRDLCTVKQ